MHKLIIAILISSVILAGCSFDMTQTTNKAKEYTIQLYQLVDTGTTFKWEPEKVVTATTLSGAVKKFINSMQNQKLLPPGDLIISVKLENNRLVLNFNDKIMQNPGAGAEIEQQVLCAFAKLAKMVGAKTVEILINGQKPTEENGYADFWGHIGLYENIFDDSICGK